MYFFEDHFDREALKRNFEFYEPRTVHESSLSPCVHSILASVLDMEEKAYEMYLRTGRLDLDNYNNDTEDGLHITSMAGTWLAIIKGFAGMRVRDDMVTLQPKLPQQWKGLTFHLYFRNNILRVSMSSDQTVITNVSGGPFSVEVNESIVEVQSNSQYAVSSAQNH
jgi:maltose phosphorylase